jgi:hypothetical protein
MVDLTKVDFSGGTLVEYAVGCGINMEYSRSKILSVQYNKKEFWIETDDPYSSFFFILNYLGSVYVTSEGVYFVNSNQLTGNWFALAPKNVEIAKPEERFLKVCYN